MTRTSHLFVAATPMAQRHRDFPWEATPLGTPQAWDPALKTLVQVMLASSQPMFVVWGGSKTLLYNDPYAEILGNKHPDALGRDFLEVWHEIRADLVPIVAAAYDGEPVRMDDIQLWMERRGYREETHFSFSYSPVRAESGEIGGFFCACNEITAQILAERRLAESEARHRGVLENMDEGFVLFDRDFVILEVNKAAERLVGLEREDLIGHNHWERFPGSFDSSVGRMYLQVLAEQRPHFLEHLYRFPDGRECWFELRAFPVGDGLAALFRDITARKRMIEALQQADRRKDEFLAMLAHELRNPLAPISTASHVLRLLSADHKRVREASDIIERQVRHMTRLVDDLLEVSRVTRGLVQLERGPVDLQSVVSTALEQVKPLLQARRHELRARVGAGPLTVEGDFHRLVQVTANLLHNAAKFTPQGGVIEIELAVEDDCAALSVIDNGAGIEPGMIDRVFELFVQGERTPDRSEGGLGIGLALVRSLVQLHGGTVRAESTGLQQGSAFRIRLPLSSRVRPSGPECHAPRAEAHGRILIVDDNVDAATTLCDMLQLIGHTVATAHDARGALARAADGGPWDAVILDLGLPDMTGYELAGRLRQLPAARQSVFIALTGYGQAQDRAISLASGFDHHLVKPANIALLVGLLSRAPGS